MSKILLVEDDNKLREIYELRLKAEGYEIVSAKDGEEALAVAKQEKPDLIISDVMMPKISGFEMLDILRNTPMLKDTKIIMLTALGQAEDQAKANTLGADRYLVKSQVTLEDIVTASNELLNNQTDEQTGEASSLVDSNSEVPVITPSISTNGVVPAPTEPTMNTAPANEPGLVDTISKEAQSIDTQTEAQENATMDQQINNFLNNPPIQSNDNPTFTQPPTTDVQPTTPSLNNPYQQNTPPVSSPAPTFNGTDTNSTPTPAVNTVSPPSDSNPPTQDTTTNDNVASNDKTLADAVNNLMNTDPTPSNDNPTTSTDIPNPASSSTEPESSPTNSKRIIQPLDNNEPHKSLDQLLAEEANNQSTDNSQNPFDPSNPNNISL